MLADYFPDLFSQVEAILAGLSTDGQPYIPSFLRLQQSINVRTAHLCILAVLTSSLS